MVSGKRPKEQGEKDVSSPAKYNTKREAKEEESIAVDDDDDDDDVLSV